MCEYTLNLLIIAGLTYFWAWYMVRNVPGRSWWERKKK